MVYQVSITNSINTNCTSILWTKGPPQFNKRRFFLDYRDIPYAVERNPEKYGKKMECVGIPIISEDEARSLKPDYMMILPWFFADYFIEREKVYLQSGGHFIIPLPTPRIVWKNKGI